MKNTTLKFKDQETKEDKELWLSKEIKDCAHSYHFPDLNTRIPLKFKNKNRIAVDVGANVGAFCCYASPYFDKIYAIEAAKNTYEVLKENTEHLENIEAEHFAAAATTGDTIKLTAHPGGLSGDTSAFGSRDESTVLSEDSETISLEDIYKRYDLEYIDYLKVDCEGSEYDFLMNKDLSRINYMAIEVHPGFVGEEKIEKLKTYFQKYFALNYTIGEHILFYRAWPHHVA